MNILEEANKLTSSTRRKEYGHPKEFYARMAQFASIIFNKPITPEEIGYFMIAYKLCRQLNTKKRDNLVDIAGYARTLEMLDESDSLS